MAPRNVRRETRRATVRCVAAEGDLCVLVGHDQHPRRLCDACEAVRPFASSRYHIGALTRERRFVSAVIVDAVYGHRITSLEDPYVMMMDRATEASTAGTMSGSVLDIFPFCEHSTPLSL